MTPLRRYLDAIGEDFSAVWRGGGTEATVRTVAVEKADPRGVIVTCEECGVELAADSPDLRLELNLRRSPAHVLRVLLAERVRGLARGPAHGAPDSLDPGVVRQASKRV
jgi:hypothetical protein